VRVPDAEDDLGTGLGEPTARTSRDLFAERVERVHAGESREGGGRFAHTDILPPPCEMCCCSSI
jgi:hypothetical protein